MSYQQVLNSDSVQEPFWHDIIIKLAYKENNLNFVMTLQFE